MFFALLILVILATLVNIWYGRTMYAALFMLTLIGAVIVLVHDIDTPLHLTF
jgi:asparagine N-glycosylation enzyme membrane subunit Stt3